MAIVNSPAYFTNSFPLPFPLAGQLAGYLLGACVVLARFLLGKVIISSAAQQFTRNKQTLITP